MTQHDINNSPDDQTPDQDKLDELNARIKAARGDDDVASAAITKNPGALGKGMKASSELIAAIAVACAIGYGLDRLIGTTPLFIVMGVFLGFASGVLNIKRSMDRAQAELEAEQESSEEL